MSTTDDASYKQWSLDVVAGKTLLSYGDWKSGLVSTPPVSTETPLTLGEYWAAGKAVHLIGRPSAAHPYRCGAREGGGSSLWADVTCADCLSIIEGVGIPTPLHTPPEMGDATGNDDGVFTFHDTHLGKDYTLEVVPQTTGNVEITLSSPGTGNLFTLSHLDRADVLRALLYDFHYSPERGGPNDS